MRRGLVEIRYVGRRSGKTFEIPVGYRRSGDTITIGVSMPDGKNWWRNFLGEGGSITFLGLDGSDRTGHAVATRDERGRVSVTARLDVVADQTTLIRRRRACGGTAFRPAAGPG